MGFFDFVKNKLGFDNIDIDNRDSRKREKEAERIHNEIAPKNYARLVEISNSFNVLNRQPFSKSEYDEILKEWNILSKESYHILLLLNKTSTGQEKEQYMKVGNKVEDEKQKWIDRYDPIYLNLPD